MAPTARVSPETRERLARLRSSPQETYEDVVRRLLSLVPEGDEEGLYTEAFRVGLLDARVDVREGRMMDQDRVKRRRGL